MQMIVTDYHVTLEEPILGSTPGNPKVHTDFKLTKALEDSIISDKTAQKEHAAVVETAKRYLKGPIPKDTAELEKMLEEEIDKTLTVFPSDERGLFLWNYQMKGFFKETTLSMIELGEGPPDVTKYSHKRFIGSYFFIFPRKIYLLKEGSDEPYKEPLKVFERPLRAETRQGERTALAASEFLPPGTHVKFQALLLQGTKVKLEESYTDNCLHYGMLKGLGQWRSGGFGRFKWEKLKTSPSEKVTMKDVAEIAASAYEENPISQVSA